MLEVWTGFGLASARLAPWLGLLCPLGGLGVLSILAGGTSLLARWRSVPSARNAGRGADTAIPYRPSVVLLSARFWYRMTPSDRSGPQTASVPMWFCLSFPTLVGRTGSCSSSRTPSLSRSSRTVPASLFESCLHFLSCLEHCELAFRASFCIKLICAPLLSRFRGASWHSSLPSLREGTAGLFR